MRNKKKPKFCVKFISTNFSNFLCIFFFFNFCLFLLQLLEFVYIRRKISFMPYDLILQLTHYITFRQSQLFGFNHNCFLYKSNVSQNIRNQFKFLKKKKKNGKKRKRNVSQWPCFKRNFILNSF